MSQATRTPEGNQGKRVTIREVAQATGLSPAAVSYALRGIHVSEKTEERVRRVASELGYEANPIARALASGRTGMIGIVGQSLENLWQQRLAADAGRALLAHNRFALILDAAGDPVRQRALAAQLRDQQVDGLIVSPIDASDPFWAQLAGTLAVVSIGERVAGAAGEVMFNNDRAIAAALEQLGALGHRRIAYLCPAGGPADEHASVPIVGRLAAGLGLEVSVTVTPYELAAATRTAHHVLSDPRGATAIFCFSDSFAHGVYAAARELGLAIPDDISVIGYDDQVISALLTPPLTSVDWSSTQLMEIAVEMVLGAIDGELPSNPVVIEGTLRRRASTGPPPVARTRTRQGLPRASDQLPSAP